MTEEHYHRLRLRMVEEQLPQRGIRDARVLDAHGPVGCRVRGETLRQASLWRDIVCL